MPSQASVPLKAPLKEAHFVELVGIVLKQMQFMNPQCSTNFCTVSAAREYRDGDFSYSYSVNVNYEPADSEVTATVSFSELEQGDMNHRCKVKCDEFVHLFQSLMGHGAKRAGQTSTRYGSAHWAVMPDDLKSNNDDDNFIIDMNHRSVQERLILGKCDYTKFISVPPKITDAHAAVMGPSGAGKSTGILIPNLIDRWATSMIATEATNGESEQADIFKKTAGFRQAMGHQIYWFNPTLMNSTRINPLDMITDAEPDKRFLAAQKIAHLVIQNSHGGGDGGIDKHWDKAAYLLLIALFMQIVEGIDDPKYKHIGTVLELLRMGPDTLNEYIKNGTSERAKQRFEIFYNNSTTNYARSVMVTLIPKLDAWVTPQVATLMSKSDITPKQLSKQLYTFYLSVPSKRDDLKPVTAMVLNYILDVLSYRPFEHNLSLLLDEFTNFGYIPSFQSIYTTIRKSKVPFVLGFQDQAQLEDVYGKNKTRIILNNTATKIYNTPSPGDLVQARLISEALGRKTETESTILSNCQVQSREYGRNLMTPDEVLAMDKLTSLVFTSRSSSNVPPIKLQKFEPTEYAWAEKQCSAPTRADHPIDNTIIPVLTKPQTNAGKKSDTPSKSAASTSTKAKSKPQETPTKPEQDEPQPTLKPDDKPREDDADDIPSWLYS